MRIGRGELHTLGVYNEVHPGRPGHVCTSTFPPHTPKAVTCHDQPHYCRFMIIMKMLLKLTELCDNGAQARDPVGVVHSL